MNLKAIHNVYFIGIGGIGMSALARYFHAQGKLVAGYDKTTSPLTSMLIDEGIFVSFEDTLAAIPAAFKVKETTLVVYTPAIPNTHKELSYFVAQGFSVFKRAEVLGLITKHTYCFAVAGTHGKTTTSSILGHLLKEANASMTAFLGGIATNYQSNLILNGHENSVVEADEYDRSFLQLSPDIACVTSMDADHLDCYGAPEALEQSFRDFAAKLPSPQKLLVRNGLALQGLTYGINDDASYSIQDINIIDGAYHFAIKTPKEVIENIRFHLPGEHNLLNALAAFAMAYEEGYAAEKLVRALASFKGVARRFAYQIKTKEVVFIDDYAHHPTAIDAVHQAIREMYPEQAILVVFQPHLFSRTQDFAADFAKSLSQFDTVRLLDIYPAREAPIPGVDSEWLLSKMKHPDKKLIKKEAIVTELLANKGAIILTIGAGDIGVEVPKIKEKLLHEMALG